MKKYYKVNVCSEDMDLSGYNQEIIVEKGLLYAKEIVTKERLMICDNKAQGSMYYYYVMSSDFKQQNIARFDEVNDYFNNFEISKFPVCSKQEEKMIKKLVKRHNQIRKNTL